MVFDKVGLLNIQKDVIVPAQAVAMIHSTWAGPNTCIMWGMH